MDYQLSDRKAALARALLNGGMLDDSPSIVGVIDLEVLGTAVGALKAAFPRSFLHAYAVKANCAPGVLSYVRAAGMACEVASAPELHAAVAAGFPPESIVFDSPAKTREEIQSALSLGVSIYIDNFQELSRVDEESVAQRSSTIGIRVNPQVGIGTISSTSTATSTSKFGVGLDDPGNRALLIAAFVGRPWLNALHVHVGSQGCPLQLSVQGIKRVVELAASINAACNRRRIGIIDIGGGLPVNFASDTVSPTFDQYASLLRDAVPNLFDGTMEVVTEFGRAIIAKAGFIVARVEYTKAMGGRRIAITHAGAQVATRTVYQPDVWPVRISALDRNGFPKTGPLAHQDVAGPCCFAGDLLAENRVLPLLEPGDYILVHDTGGYYFSTPYRYNSLPPIDTYGATGADSNPNLISLDEPQRSSNSSSPKDPCESRRMEE